MNRAIAILVLTALQALPALAAELELPRDGWGSWEVPAVGDAPAWCCFEGNGSPASRPTCKLDEANRGYGNRDDAKTESVRIYARFAAGTLERLRPLAAD